MRLNLSTLAAAFALASCGQSAELSECEEDILRDLRSPSTYQLISESGFSSPITIEELGARYLPERLERFDREIMDDLAARDLQLMRQTIEYGAANAYGTPVRGEKTCYFLEADGRSYRVPEEVFSARIEASMNNDDREMEENPHFDAEENFSSVVDCCLPL